MVNQEEHRILIGFEQIDGQLKGLKFFWRISLTRFLIGHIQHGILKLNFKNR